MTNRNNRPIEEELRSSQVYKTLTGTGIPLAGKLAEGLGKAAQGIDSAISGLNASARQGNAPTGAYYQRYQQGPGPQQGTGWQQPQSQQTQQTQQPRQAPPQPRQTTQTRQAQQPPQQGAGAPGQARQAPPAGYYQYQQRPQGAPPQGQQPPRPAPGPAPVQGAPQAQGAPPAPQPPMKLVHMGSPAKFYITGAAAIVYALVGPMSQPVHFLIFAVVLALVFLLSSVLFKGKKRFVPIQPEQPKEEPESPEKEESKEEKSSTGNPEVDRIIDEGNQYLKKLRAANDAIPDEALSEDIDRMERASADIFRYIIDHPEKAPQIRKFMNYYLPTTLKLLGSYQRLSSQSVKGENITSTLFNIAGMMHTVADAFEKQLDSLFTDEAMDISADITVFETLLKQEGFVDENKGKKQGK